MGYGTNQALRKLALFGAIAIGSLAFAASAQASGYIEGTVRGVDREQHEVFGNKLCAFVYSKSSSPDSSFLGSAIAPYPGGDYRASMHGSSPFPDGSYRVMFDDCLPSDGDLPRGEPEKDHYCGTSCGYKRTWYDGTRSGAGSFQAARDVDIAGRDVSRVDVAISLYGQEVSPGISCKQAKKQVSKKRRAVRKAKKQLRKARKNDGNVAKKRKQLNKAKRKLQRKRKAKQKAC